MSAELAAPLARVCRVLGAPRSTASHRRRRLSLLAGEVTGARPGPATAIPDAQLVDLIRSVLAASPFAGEGYRKVRAGCVASTRCMSPGNGCCG